MGIEDHLKGKVLSYEAPVDLEKLKAFRAEHDKHLDKKCRDPVFSYAYTIKYKNCNLGTCVNIVCECGADVDITDYDGF
jgi:hypothetical protein